MDAAVIASQFIHGKGRASLVAFLRAARRSGLVSSIHITCTISRSVHRTFTIRYVTLRHTHVISQAAACLYDVIVYRLHCLRAVNSRALARHCAATDTVSVRFRVVSGKIVFGYVVY